MLKPVSTHELNSRSGEASWMLTVANQKKFFLRLGKRIGELRRKLGHSQEDMISFGFSARHWQQIEKGRPITVSTLLRICAVFEVSVECLVRGLDNGIYEK
jgi:DNA-binding Xre family transcriptional regulator